jgi:peptidoglycan/LPS O-acetylase OafA/YrhL
VVPVGSAVLYFGLAFSHGKDWLTEVGACGVILSCMFSGVLRGWLRGRVPQYLGRVSFSLYLVHGTVLFALLDSLYGRLPVAGLGVVYVGLALAAAHGFCVVVEEPAMRWGRRLAARSGVREVVPVGVPVG